MDRLEFCQQLVQARENVGVSKNEQCRRTGVAFKQLQLLESKPNNFAINKAIDYLTAIGCSLVISNGKQAVSINYASDFSDWLKDARHGKFSQRALADAVGCVYPTIANIERGKTIVTIDTFLKIIDVLGYTVQIENK